MLRRDREVGSFLDGPAVAIAPTIDQPSAEKPGMTIGRYKLLQEIGEGGMGVVYMAEQREPVRRKVALKIIKPGMDTREVVARFEAERQALAMMDHPNIAHVLDGGATESGRPYFVMERVQGMPITEYCDEAELSAEERLRLFVSVCDAVQHAHQKGIIHRDIKPSNVLVTLHGETPVPKIIDFGVAKATNRELTEKTVFTGHGQLLGTPLYMSPEQVGISGLDVDTRSDIYSLGVLLYELLTGTTPFDKEQLQEAGFDEMRRVIREEEPPRPSTRVTTLGDAADTISMRRSTSPGKLSVLLRGELDWIVMKALEKDRARRYETANGFAKDIECYLKDEAVEACPPSTTYRLRKFLRRNRIAVSSAAVVVLSLLILMVGITLVSVSQREIAERRIRVQQEINDALTEVARLRGQVSATALGDQTTLTRAREQMQRALALADAGPADAKLVAQVRQLASELDQEQRDRQLLAALDAAWLAEPSLTWDRRFANEKSVPLLRKALTADGLAVGRDDPQAAAAQIKSRQEEVRSEIVAALYEWYTLLSPPIGVVLEDKPGFRRGGLRLARKSGRARRTLERRRPNRRHRSRAWSVCHEHFWDDGAADHAPPARRARDDRAIGGAARSSQRIADTGDSARHNGRVVVGCHPGSGPRSLATAGARRLRAGG